MFKVIQKKSGRLHLPTNQTSKWKHAREVFLFCMLLAGLIFGALAVRTSENEILDRLYTLLQNYLDVKAQQSVWSSFSNTCLKRVLLLLLLYCVGTCAFGAPVLYAVPAVCGTGIGMVGAYMYKAYALKGIGYCALLWYPGEVLFLAAMLLACSVSITMTNVILQSFSSCPDTQEHVLRAYTSRYGVILLLTVGSAIPETLLCSIFSGYFQFS